MSGHDYWIAGDSLNHAAAFIRSEEECSVFLNGTAKSSAKLVLLIVRGGRIEKASGIQRLIAEKLIGAAVPIVGAGFGDNIDDGAGVAAVFGVKGVGENAKFSDAIGRWLNGRRVHEQVVAVAAVHAKVVGASTAAIDRNGARLIAAVKEV